MVGSVGSNTARSTLRAGRLRVMLLNTTPLGSPTVGASALVDANTCVPAAITTLLPLAGATSTFPVVPGEATMRHVPLDWRCHRFCAPLMYKMPETLGSAAI